MAAHDRSAAPYRRHGMTLAELLVTVAIIGALTTLIIPQLANRSASASQTVTLTTLNQLRQAVRTYYSDMYETLPFPQDPSRVVHPQLVYLYVNPSTYADPNADNLGLATWSHDPNSRRGWSGPYLTNGLRYTINTTTGFVASYGRNGDPTPVDAWGNPIVLQQPVLVSGVFSPSDRRYARLVSAGPNGILEINEADPVPTVVGDDLFLKVEDLYPGSGVAP